MTIAPTDRAELRVILTAYLEGQPAEGLQSYLMEKSNLPGVRGNIELIAAFADLVGEVVKQPRARVDRVEALLDSWAQLPLDRAPINHPREILPAAAAEAYGAVAAARPEWRQDELAKLKSAATDRRWRTREMVANGLQRMLEVNWTQTCSQLVGWAGGDHPLIARAAVAAVAEPRLLSDKTRAEDALAVQAEAVSYFLSIAPERRRDEEVRALRQALGYTLSVVTAASPETGFHLMEELAALPDPDIVWIVRENMKKKRLQPWQDRLSTLETALFRPEHADLDEDDEDEEGE